VCLGFGTWWVTTEDTEGYCCLLFDFRFQGFGICSLGLANLTLPKKQQGDNPEEHRAAGDDNKEGFKTLAPTQQLSCKCFLGHRYIIKGEKINECGKISDYNGLKKLDLSWGEELKTASGLPLRPERRSGISSVPPPLAPNVIKLVC